MARANNNTQRMDDLLASVTGDLLGDLPAGFQDNSLRVERILLEWCALTQCSRAGCCRRASI